MIVAGIDPGVTGAVAVFHPESRELILLDMPVFAIKRNGHGTREIDVAQLAIEMESYLPQCKSPIIYIEKVGAMPGQSVASMFAFGRGLGMLEGVLASLQLGVNWATPSIWRRSMAVPEGKDGSRQRATQIFPRHSEYFRRAMDHGRADAALIAAWGARQQGVQI